ncbi:hypothetical protein AE41_04871, partial [Enterobacter hormaechei]
MALTGRALNSNVRCTKHIIAHSQT